MIIFILYFSIFVIGLCIGSFLNCVIYRLESKKSFIKGRSFCPHCKHSLAWIDLVPVLSFLILKGKCRYCGKPISWQYPLVEISTGFLFLQIVLNQLPIINNQLFAINNELSLISFQSIVSIFYLLLMSCFFIIIFIFDLKHYIIPDKAVYPAIAIASVYQLIAMYCLSFINNQLAFLSALGAGIFFLAIVLISRGKGMGVGDIKLAFLMGLFLGFPNILVALFSAFVIGAIIGVVLILISKKTFKSQVPFGPFLIIGTFLAFFWGEKIVDWYLSFIL